MLRAVGVAYDLPSFTRLDSRGRRSPREILSPQKLLQGLNVGIGEVGVALGPHTVAVGDGVLRLLDIELHALLALCDVSAESVAVAGLLGAQAVEAAVYRAGAGGDLIDFMLERIEIDGRRRIGIGRGLGRGLGRGRGSFGFHGCCGRRRCRFGSRLR